MGFIESNKENDQKLNFYKQILAQIELELSSQIRYYNLACFFENIGMKNLSKFFFHQAEEENKHAHKFMNFLLDSGVFFQVGNIIVPEFNLSNHNTLSDKVLEAFKGALYQEMVVTRGIHNICDIVKNKRYYEIESLLNWFTEEQMEEESTMQDLIDQFNICGNNLLLLDNSDYVRGLLVAE